MLTALDLYVEQAQRALRLAKSELERAGAVRNPVGGIRDAPPIGQVIDLALLPWSFTSDQVEADNPGDLR